MNGGDGMFDWINVVYIAICLLISLGGFLIGQKSGAKKEGFQDGMVAQSLAHIKESLERLEAEIKSANIAGLTARVEACERDIRDLKRGVVYGASER